MRGFLIFLLSISVASAQLSVQIRAPKDTFLVYESIPVTISIRNYSGRTIQLENTGVTSWLKFQVTDEQNQFVEANVATVKCIWIHASICNATIIETSCINLPVVNFPVSIIVQ